MRKWEVAAVSNRDLIGEGLNFISRLKAAPTIYFNDLQNQQHFETRMKYFALIM